MVMKRSYPGDDIYKGPVEGSSVVTHHEKTDWSGNPVPLTLMERVTFLEAKVKYLESELDRFALIVIKKTVMDVLKDSDRCSGGQLRY